MVALPTVTVTQMQTLSFVYWVTESVTAQVSKSTPTTSASFVRGSAPKITPTQLATATSSPTTVEIGKTMQSVLCIHVPDIMVLQ